MKKFLLALSVLSTCFYTGKAQSIQILDTAHATISVAPLSYTFNVDVDSSLDVLFWVKNTTASQINIQLKSYVLANPGSDIISYCIGTQCHNAGQNVTVNTPIAPNGTLTANGLLTEFTAFNAGASQVLYTLFNPLNTKDSVSVKVYYNITAAAGIKQFANNYTVSNMAPNPASNNVTLNYDLKGSSQAATLKIYNMLGTAVKTVALESYNNSSKIDISSLEEGMYFYSVLVGGKAIKTSRLVVSR